MKKRILTLVTALVLVLALVAGCTSNQPGSTAEKTKVNVAALNGPTGMGLAKLMDDQDKGTTKNDYSFTLSGAPDDIVAKITSGEVDIAAVPTNLAAVLYNKTNGNVRLIAANTLGVLYIASRFKRQNALRDGTGRNARVCA